MTYARAVDRLDRELLLTVYHPDAIDLNGNEAHAETYYMFVGLNRRGTPLAMSGGRYIDRLENAMGGGR